MRKVWPFLYTVQKRTRTVSAGDTVRIEMAPGGGFAARIEQVGETGDERP